MANCNVFPAETSFVSSFRLDGSTYEYIDIESFAQTHNHNAQDIPLTYRYLIEYLLRAGETDTAISLLPETSCLENPSPVKGIEIPFSPSRIVMQDYTAVPAMVDLASIRDLVNSHNGCVTQVFPVLPVDIVIDHSVLIDDAMSANSLAINEENELHRNRERYGFLKWCENTFSNVSLFPPGNGIVHQLNMEKLTTMVHTHPVGNGRYQVVLDSVLGTDSHTTMINGIGVLGWGVGGLEATTLMLGKASRWRMPNLLGIYLSGKPADGTNATDIALTLARKLRAQQVGGCFVEIFGPGLKHLSAQDRCTIANMAPEYGVKTALFPVDQAVLDYLALTGRSAHQLELISETYRSMGLLAESNVHGLSDSFKACFNNIIELDLSEIEPVLAGPNLPHIRHQPDRPTQLIQPGIRGEKAPAEVLPEKAVAIASLTSCTNTANPALMISAALLAKNAALHGLEVPWYVKTSLAPGSRAVTDYLSRAKLLPYLEQLGFHIVGYGCTTCNGGGGDLLPGVQSAQQTSGVELAAVVSGNRNFAGRIHPGISQNFLASPVMVVAYALAGSIDFDFSATPLGYDKQNNPVYLHDIYPTRETLNSVLAQFVTPESYSQNMTGTDIWQAIPVPEEELYPWDQTSTYLKSTPYNIQATPLQATSGCRPLLLLGDDITTDDISPVGKISPNSEAGRYLINKQEHPSQLNTFGSRRGHYEVMLHGAFSNPQLEKEMASPCSELSDSADETNTLSVLQVARYMQVQQMTPIIVAGKNYGMGSSRDWAAKATALLGVKVVLAESFERIHRYNVSWR